MENKFEFENLDVYKKTIQLIEQVYLVTQKFPRSELYGLVSQFRRCSTSVALNIAEGYGKYHKKLKNQFYYTARASL